MELLKALGFTLLVCLAMKTHLGLAAPTAPLMVTATADTALVGGTATEKAHEYARLSSKASQSLLLDIAVSKTRLVAVGERGHVIYSDDDGVSWQQGRVPSTHLLTAVAFVGRHGWVVGHDAVILHTQDAGETWSVQHIAPITDDPLTDASLTETQEWTDDAIDLIDRRGSPLLDVWFFDQQHGIAVGAYGYFLLTRDAGASWQDVSNRIDNVDGLHLNGIGVAANGDVYLVGESGIVYRSRDRGEQWETLNSPYEGSLFGVTTTRDPARVYIYGLGGKVYLTQNAGQDWVAVPTTASTGLMGGGLTSDGKVIVVGNAGTVLIEGDAESTLRTFSRQDRQSIVNVFVNANDDFITVGQGGVKRFARRDLTQQSNR